MLFCKSQVSLWKDLKLPRIVRVKIKSPLPVSTRSLAHLTSLPLMCQHWLPWCVTQRPFPWPGGLLPGHSWAYHLNHS